MRLWMIAAALVAGLSGVPAQAREAVHYDVRARIGADGMLDAEVRIELNREAAGRGKAFLISRRFAVSEADAGAGTSVTVTPVEKPVEQLARYDFVFARPGPHTLRFRYRGPLDTPHDSGVKAIREDAIELFLDHMWLPFGADIQTMFTADARIDGLPRDTVVVAQGKVMRTQGGVRIHRELLDIDLPMVAMRGLERATAPGVEYFARELATPVSRLYVTHSAAASAYFRRWFGPLPDPDPIRIVAVSRARKLGYTRTAYTVVNDTGRAADAGDEGLGTARHIAHEIAHGWWRSASPISEDFWLVESVAEYAAWRYAEQAFGAGALARLAEAARGPAAAAGPIMGHGRPTRAQLYQKGPLLLLALERRIGRDRLDALLRGIVGRPPHTSAQFFAALRSADGSEAATWFEAALKSEALDA